MSGKWTDEMRKALDVLLEGASNPQEIVAYMEETAKAQAQADALDDAGFQRKAVTPDAGAQTLHGPGGLLSEPGVEENGKAMDPSGKCPKCGKQMKDGKCPDHGNMMDAGNEEPADSGKKAVDPARVTPPTGREDKKGLQPQGILKTQLGQTRPLLTTDIGDMYAAITDIIETRVTKAVQDATAAIYAEASKAFKERDEILAEHEKQFQELDILKEAVLVQKAYDDMVAVINEHSEHIADVQMSTEKLAAMTEQLNETNTVPRISQIFKNLAASEADATVIADDHPLAKAHPAEIAGSDLFAKYGLKPSRSNGSGRAAS